MSTTKKLIPNPFFATAKHQFERESNVLKFNPTGKIIVEKRNGEIYNFVRNE
jgi:hypothetical protein